MPYPADKLIARHPLADCLEINAFHAFKVIAVAGKAVALVDVSAMLGEDNTIGPPAVDDEWKYRAMTVFVAGFETTALALSASPPFSTGRLKMSFARLKPQNSTAPVPTMVGMIDGFRWAIFGGGTPLYLPGLAISIFVFAVMLVTGTMYFRSTEKRFADVI